MSTRGFVRPLLILSLLHCGGSPPPETPSRATVAAPVKEGPNAHEVQEALTRGDVEKARALLVVFAAREGDTPDVRDSRDAIALAEAEKLTGAARLDALDPIAGRGGAHAEEAAQAAKKERLRQVQQLIDAKRAAEAMAALDRWFGDRSKSDAQVAEARARAHDVASVLCGDAACRYLEAYRASAWANTPDRTDRIAEARTAVIAALTFQEVPAEPALDRLRRLRAVVEMTTRMSKELAGDSELQGKATALKTWAEAERAKVAVLGSDGATAEELWAPSRSRAQRSRLRRWGRFSRISTSTLDESAAGSISSARAARPAP
jgi:hypothetical protein